MEEYIKRQKNFQEEFAPKPGETEKEANDRESAKGLFNPQRFIDDKKYIETRLDWITDAKSLIKFIDEV